MQMSIGILTEKGILMTSAPVLINDSNFSFFKKSNNSKRIQEI